jgi:hypothetical protein
MGTAGQGQLRLTAHCAGEQILSIIPAGSPPAIQHVPRGSGRLPAPTSCDAAHQPSHRRTAL